jgi:RNA polymerase sigma factor (sigma-70 family)
MRKKNNYEDIEKIIEQIKNNNLENLDLLCEFYLPLVKNIVRKIIEINPKLNIYREDLMSESKLAILDLIKKYDPQLCYFSYYLCQHLFYVLLNRCRKNIYKINVKEISFDDMPIGWEPLDTSDPFGKIETKNVLNYAINQLSIKQKEAIYWYFFQNKTQEEASAILNISQTSFSKRIKRSLEKIKKILEKNKN